MFYVIYNIKLFTSIVAQSCGSICKFNQTQSSKNIFNIPSAFSFFAVSLPLFAGQNCSSPLCVCFVNALAPTVNKEGLALLLVGTSYNYINC